MRLRSRPTNKRVVGDDNAWHVTVHQASRNESLQRRDGCADSSSSALELRSRTLEDNNFMTSPIKLDCGRATRDGPTDDTDPHCLFGLADRIGNLDGHGRDKTTEIKASSPKSLFQSFRVDPYD
jgi:hypothetical protein